MKQNFRSYLESEKPDASEIVDDDKILYKIVKSSYRTYNISIRDGFDEDEHYHVQYIADDILSWFKEHKSRNRNCFRELEAKYEVEMDMEGNPYHDFYHEDYEFEVESIIGSFEVFKRFKEECFEK